MRAAVLQEVGKPPEPGEFEEPVAGEGSEVVQVLAGGLNPYDVFAASGMAGPQAVPLVPGTEGVGRIPDGNRIYFESTVAPFGSFAERALARTSAMTAVLPDGIDDADALPFGIAGLAGWLPLAEAAQLQPGESVLVLGATGVAGQVGAQAAKLMGASRVVGAGRNEETLATVRERGADEVVRLGGEDDAAALQEAAGDGFDVILDTLFGPPLQAALGSTRRGGRIVTVGASGGFEVTLDVGTYLAKGLSHRSFGNSNVSVDTRRQAFLTMVDHAIAGRLVVEVERVPLDQIAEAWAAQARGPHRKIAIIP